MFPAAYQDQEYLSFNRLPPSLFIFLDIYCIHERIKKNQMIQSGQESFLSLKGSQGSNKH